MNYSWKLPGLGPLYRDMKRERKFQEQFSFCLAGAEFEVIFLIDRTPFELLIGIKGTRLAFILTVKPYFNVAAIPDNIFKELKKYLKLSFGLTEFTSKDFLYRLESSTPSKCSCEIVQPHQVAKYKRDAIPDPQKIYFLGWNNHLRDGRTARNIWKTRKICGDSVADFCERNNISSMWSDQVKDTKRYTPPPGYVM